MARTRRLPHQGKLKTLLRDLKRLRTRLHALHDKTGYEDLGHGVLGLAGSLEEVAERYE